MSAEQAGRDELLAYLRQCHPGIRLSQPHGRYPDGRPAEDLAWAHDYQHEHWPESQGHVHGQAPVTDLFKACSYLTHPERSSHGEVAASDCCRAPASSAVLSGTNLLWRCRAHEGQVAPGVRGEVVREVPR